MKNEAKKVKLLPDINIDIDISVRYEAWEQCGFNPEPVIRKAVSMAIEQSCFAAMVQGSSAEISIVLADDAFVQTLNRDYRDKDKRTNVLSFPQTDFSDPESFKHFIAFGDIIMAYETIEREAGEQNKRFRDHFSHLTVHGTLHLMGYDHDTPEEAKEMESLEITILKQMGVENPYSDTNFMA